MGDFSEVLTLLATAPGLDEGQPPITGATSDDLRVLREQLGFDLPEQLVDWLMVCNGSLAGPGGLFGANQQNDFLDIAGRMYDGWHGRRWIPVAGDGCGDFYVLDASRTHLPTGGIFFVDQSDYDALCYLLATNLEVFFRQLLLDDRDPGEGNGWPFDSKRTLAADPRLVEVQPQRLLPWRA